MTDVNKLLGIDIYKLLTTYFNKLFAKDIKNLSATCINKIIHIGK